MTAAPSRRVLPVRSRWPGLFPVARGQPSALGSTALGTSCRESARKRSYDEHNKTLQLGQYLTIEAMEESPNRSRVDAITGYSAHLLIFTYLPCEWWRLRSYAKPALLTTPPRTLVSMVIGPAVQLPAGSCQPSWASPGTLKSCATHIWGVV